MSIHEADVPSVALPSSEVQAAAHIEQAAFSSSLGADLTSDLTDFVLPTFTIPETFDLADWESSVQSAPQSVYTRPTPRLIKVLGQVHSAAKSPVTVISDGLILFVAGLLGGVSPASAAGLAAVAVLLAFYVGQVYRDRDTIQSKGVSWYPGRVIMPLGVVVLVAMLTGLFQAKVAAGFYLFGFVGLVGLRCTTWAALTLARHRGLGMRRTLIVGSGPSVSTVAAKLKAFPQAGLAPIGSLALGDVLIEDGMSAAIRVTGAEHVILAPELGDEEIMAESIRRCQGVAASFSLLPPLADLFLHPASVNEIGGLPLVPLGRVLHRRSTFPGKRVLDVSIASVSLLFLSPVLLVAAMAVKLDTPGPVFYRQRRVGRDSHGFGMIKFRSMVVGADQHFDALRRSTANVTDGLLFKHADDPRITRVGRWLRRTSIDELPQLVNVILGHMSLVGPRPLAVAADEFDTLENERHSVLPGITGYWQISGGNDLTYSEMVRLDLAYIRNWTLWLDIRLLAKTIPALLSRRGPS